MSTPPRHAAVLGGGWAGVLHAWVLAEAGWQVTVVERHARPDAPDTEPGPAAGVPQGHHLHLFMPSGLAGLDRLLPGIADRLVARGAQPLTIPGDIRWMTSAGWMPELGPHHVLVCCTRPLMDRTVRGMVLPHHRITELHRAEADGLLVAGSRVVGVRLRPLDGSGTRELSADLVVDATGRRSATPQWLADLGLPAPAEDTVDSGVAYASGLFRRTGAAVPGGRRALFLQPHPTLNPRGGTVFPVEDDRWIVTLSGVRGYEPPTDPDGFLRFTEQLRSPEVHELLRTLEPAGPLHGFRPRPSRRRHYHRLRGLPDGLVVTADAACTFNPQYGHGMSVAVDCAQALRRILGQHPADPAAISRQAGRAIHRASRTAWQIAGGEDLRYATTDARPRMPLLGAQHAYLDRILAAAGRSRNVQRAFLDTMTLTSAPTVLLTPAVLLPTLTGGGRRD